MVSMDFAHIGLKIRDKRVYEALVRSPEVSVRKIAEETAINRGSVFESLKSLVAVGLVTRIQYGARTMYRAKDPEVLHEIITEKRQELARADMGLIHMLHHLPVQRVALGYFISPRRIRVMRGWLQFCVTF